MLYVSGLFQTTLNDMVRPFDEHEKEYPMKLYIYDHCPFCVRARMAAGLFGADVEEVVLANDDEATPIGMIGAKQVPILQKEDGSFMGESLDCKPPPPFALCYINFCTRCVLKVTPAFALYRIAENKKSDGNVAFVFTSYK